MSLAWSSPRAILAALAACVMVAATAPASAEAAPCEVTYKGPAGGSWNVAASWEPEAPPTKLQIACIPSGKGTIRIASSEVAEARSLQAQSGIDIAAGGQLRLDGSGIFGEHVSTFTDLDVAGTLFAPVGKIITSGAVNVEGEVAGGGEVAVELTAGTLTGDGAIEPSLTNAGATIDPGGAGAIGMLRFERRFTQRPAGTLDIEIASATSFDRISVEGQASLGGRVDVSLLGSFEPHQGETWDYLTSPLGVEEREPLTSTRATFRSRSLSMNEQLEYAPGIQPPPVQTGGAQGSERPEPAVLIASTPRAIEELALGCTGSRLNLNDVFIHAGRVQLEGSAEKALIGKRVRILFNERRTVATATIRPDGRFRTTAPLPPARIRSAVSTRYTAQVGKLKSRHLKLTRRLQLETPEAGATTVTLSGTLTPPLTRPVAPIVVEQQLSCGRSTIAKRFTPSPNGHFRITIPVPAGARAAIYRLTGTVAANSHSRRRGFRTFSLPLPVRVG